MESREKKMSECTKTENTVLVNGFALTTIYFNDKDKYDNFEIFDSDTLICTFPKTGTTWTEEMAWLILNNVNFEGAKIELSCRSGFLEYSTVRICSDPSINCPPYILDSLQFTKNLKHPRLIKTHLPFVLQPKQIQDGSKKPKIIYVTRNPKDVCTSFYYHELRGADFSGSFNEYCQMFLENKVKYSPYYEHVRSFVDRQKYLDILFLKYEDMKRDLEDAIKKVAKFLNKDLTEVQVDQLKQHLNFENMKNNDSVNKKPMIMKMKQKGEFIRKGNIGSYKEDMDQEMQEKFDIWISNNFKGLEDYVYF